MTRSPTNREQVEHDLQQINRLIDNGAWQDFMTLFTHERDMALQKAMAADDDHKMRTAVSRFQTLTEVVKWGDEQQAKRTARYEQSNRET